MKMCRNFIENRVSEMLYTRHEQKNGTGLAALQERNTTILVVQNNLLATIPIPYKIRKKVRQKISELLESDSSSRPLCSRKYVQV